MAEAVETAVAAVDTVNLGSYAHDMSMLGLFMQADPIVKAVMLALIMASVWSWAIIFSKKTTLSKLNRKANIFEDSFWSGEPLDKIYQRVKNSKHDPILQTFSAGMEEWQAGIAGGVPAKESMQAGLKQRVERSMTVAITREMNALERGMTFLASVGATAPFIGLFGTVWGIMNSFSAIAASNILSAPSFVSGTGLLPAVGSTIAISAMRSRLAPSTLRPASGP